MKTTDFAIDADYFSPCQSGKEGVAKECVPMQSSPILKLVTTRTITITAKERFGTQWWWRVIESLDEEQKPLISPPSSLRVF